MTELYNRNSEKEKRQFLRNNMTAAEQKLWLQLKGKQLENCKFRRQYSVSRFIIDFYSPEIKLAIEVDGDSHFQEGAQEYDQERQQFIESAKINFLRFTNNDIYNNISAVCEVIRDKIQSLRNLPEVPPY